MLLCSGLERIAHNTSHMRNVSCPRGLTNYGRCGFFTRRPAIPRCSPVFRPRKPKRCLFVCVRKDVMDLRDDESFRGKGGGRGGPVYTENNTSTDSTRQLPGRTWLMSRSPRNFSSGDSPNPSIIFSRRGRPPDSTIIVRQPGTTIDDDAVAGFEGLGNSSDRISLIRSVTTT